MTAVGSGVRADADVAAALRDRLTRLRQLHEAALAIAVPVAAGDAGRARLLSTIVSRAVEAVGAVAGRLVVAEEGPWDDLVPGAAPSGGYVAVRHTGQVARERIRPEGDVHHVLAGGEAVFVADVTQPSPFGPFPGARARGVGSFAVVPLRAGGRTLGALVVDFPHAGDMPVEDRDVLELFAAHAAAALERAHLVHLERQHAEERAARSAAEAATRRLALLAAAGERLASSLDYQTTLQSVAQLAVPALADWCVVDVVEPGGRGGPGGPGGLDGARPRIERVAIAAADPAKEALLRELQRRYPPLWDSPQPAARVMRSGEPELLRDATEAVLAEHTRDGDHLRLMRALGIRSHIAVPLVARGQIIGAMNFAAAESGRCYGDEDLQLAVELARRAAQAVDNARLYQQARAAQHEAVTLMEQSPLAILTFAPDGSALGANRAFSALWGIPEGALQGYNILRDAQLEAAGILPSIRRAFAGEAVVVPPVRYHPGPPAHAGSPRWVEAHVYPLVGDDGAPRQVVVVLHDVDERMHREEAQRFLAEAGEVLGGTLDYDATLQRVAHLAVPFLADWCIVYLVEDDGSVRRVALAHAQPAWGAVAQRIAQDFRIDPDAGAGVPLVLRTGQAVLYPDVTLDLLVSDVGEPERLRALVEPLGVTSWMCVPLRVRDRILGAMSFIAAGASRRYRPEDLALAEDLARRAALAVDNTRLYAAERRARDEAEAAVRARDEFLSIAAHELRTPMTTLQGMTQHTLRALARHGTIEPPKLTRALSMIDERAHKLALLSQQLLDVTRLEAGRLALQREPVDLAALVRSVAAASEDATASEGAAAPAGEAALPAGAGPAGARRSSHAIAVSVPEGKVEADVDPLRLEQVLTNLLNNAAKYAPPGSPIDLTLSRPSAGRVRIAVRDRGPGIPRAHRERIFDRFYQVNLGSTASGMGLGLYISRQIVELHGGQIVAEEPPDGGARLVITLPLRPA